MLRLVIVTNYWKNSAGGGIRAYLIGLVDELKSRGIDVKVIYRNGEDFENFKVHGNKFFYPLWSLLHLWKIKPHVAHSQGTWYCLLPCVLYKKLHGCNLIHTFHTEPASCLPAGFNLFFQILLDQCDCITFVSNKLEKRIRDVWGLNFRRTAITYAGVEARNVSEMELSEFRDKFGIRGRSPIFLAQGLTAFRAKAEGLKILMKALKAVREKYPDMVLLVTRDGGYLQELKMFASVEGLNGAVVFTEDVDNPYIPIALCDIYTHISLGEGLPVALLEAMSMGKPIIASPVGGIPEAITDGYNGLLVAPEAESIVGGIFYLLQNQEYSRGLGDCAKRTIRIKFTWDQAAAKLIDIYRGL